MPNYKTLILDCTECSGTSKVTYDAENFVEPEKCPFCGVTVSNIEEEEVN